MTRTLALCLLVGCTTGSGSPAGTVDSGGGGAKDSGSGGSGGESAACSLDSQTTAQTFNAVQAEQCNVPGSMGAKHWYRGFGMLPGNMEYVQLELWDGRGAFAAGSAGSGTFTIGGSDASDATCGVCVRGLGDKGGSGQTEYFATAGTVVVTAVSSTQLAATLTNLSFVEVDPTTHAAAGTCTATLSSVALSGAVTVEGGTGGGGGGMCPTTVGDL